MRRLTSAVAVTMLLIKSAQADVIKPVDVIATSQFGIGANVENLVNGDQGPAVDLPNFGLVAAGDPGVLDDEHLVGDEDNNNYWISGCSDAGIPGGSSAEERGAVCSDTFGDPGGFSTEPVDDQIVEFEFDGIYDLTAAHIWNDNEALTAPDRGLDEFQIQVNSQRTGGTWVDIGTTYNLTAEDGDGFNNTAQVIPFSADGVRRVRFLLNSAHSGLGGVDEYVGLAEVRFEGTLDTLDLAADGDKDGDVDGFDYLKWQIWLGQGEVDTEFNSTLTATLSRADYDNNNVVNGGDLTAWEAEFSTVNPTIAFASASVPEPSSLFLASALGGLIASQRRIRRWLRW